MVHCERVVLAYLVSWHEPVTGPATRSPEVPGCSDPAAIPRMSRINRSGRATRRAIDHQQAPAVGFALARGRGGVLLRPSRHRRRGSRALRRRTAPRRPARRRAHVAPRHRFDPFPGTVLRLPSGGSALEPWLTGAALAPAQQGAFGLDGIVATGGALHLTKLDTGDLYRVAIGADGRAGAVIRITVSPALASPDGMRLIDAHTLLVVENTGALLRIALSGDTATATALADGLDQPTGVIVARGSARASSAGCSPSRPSRPTCRSPSCG